MSDTGTTNSSSIAALADGDYEHSDDDETAENRRYSSNIENDTADEDGDGSDTDEMAIQLSPCQMSSLKPSAHENALSVIQRANKCTVLNGSHVVNNFKQISPDIHSQFIKQGSEFISSEAKKLKPVYVETNGARECFDVLESENALVITGNPGEGKTATGMMTANALMKKGFKPILITSPKEWNSKVVQAAESEKLILFIDDIFGALGVDEHKVNEWLAMNEVISSHLVKKRGNVKVVCTMRKKIYNASKQRLKRFKWFRTFRVVDISAEGNVMNESEKEELLQKYFNHHNIPKESRCIKAAKIDPPHGFPHCVELYCTEPHCRRMGLAFFISPMSAVEREVQILYETGSTQYYALVLVHLSPCQKVRVELFSGEEEFDAQLLNKARVLSKIPTRDGMDIVRAIERLVDIYLKEDDDGSIGFKHDSISEMVAVIATRNSPIPAINYLNVQVLSEKTKYLIYKEADRDEYAILPKKTTLRLVVRLTDALFQGDGFSACKHHAWDNAEFIHAWLNYVKKNESVKTPGNTQLDDLVTRPIETYHVMQRTAGTRPKDTPVGLIFLLYLNKKDLAIQEILDASDTEVLAESMILAKFKREIRCPSGRRLRHPSTSED